MCVHRANSDAETELGEEKAAKKNKAAKKKATKKQKAATQKAAKKQKADTKKAAKKKKADTKKAAKKQKAATKKAAKKKRFRASTQWDPNSNPNSKPMAVQKFCNKNGDRCFEFCKENCPGYQIKGYHGREVRAEYMMASGLNSKKRNAPTVTYTSNKLGGMLCTGELPHDVGCWTSTMPRKKKQKGTQGLSAFVPTIVSNENCVLKWGFNRQRFKSKEGTTLSFEAEEEEAVTEQLGETDNKKKKTVDHGVSC